VPRTRPPYPAAFRAEAVELARTSGKTIPELAADLGVSGQTLRNWVHQVDVDAGRGRPGELTTAEREELRRAQARPSARLACHGAGAGLATGRLRRSGGTLSTAATG
jgi:transposase-like protein